MYYAGRKHHVGLMAPAVKYVIAGGVISSSCNDRSPNHRCCCLILDYIAVLPSEKVPLKDKSRLMAGAGMLGILFNQGCYVSARFDITGRCINHHHHHAHVDW